MSGSSSTLAEQHLGDRLAALVDGELGHDARERVLAHLATCAKCKAEADAQRRLKSVFAQVTVPRPSDSFLARLQGLPGGPGEDDDNRSGLFGGGGLGAGVYGMGTDDFGYARAESGTNLLTAGAGSGFRIHEVGRQPADRSPWRARRFAFAAASAVSLAAMALGGALPLAAGSDPLPQSGGRAPQLPSAAPAATIGVESVQREGGARAIVPGIGEGMAPGGALETLTTTGRYPVGIMNGSSVSPLIQPAGSAIQIDAASGISPTATPDPTSLVAPTRPGVPLTSQR